MSALGFVPTTEPVVDETTAAGDEMPHLFCCCSPNIGLCGADVADEQILDYDWSEEATCARCVAIVHAPCVLCGFTDAGPCHCGRCSA